MSVKILLHKHGYWLPNVSSLQEVAYHLTFTKKNSCINKEVIIKVLLDSIFKNLVGEKSKLISDSDLGFCLSFLPPWYLSLTSALLYPQFQHRGAGYWGSQSSAQPGVSACWWCPAHRTTGPGDLVAQWPHQTAPLWELVVPIVVSTFLWGFRHLCFSSISLSSSTSDRDFSPKLKFPYYQ